MNDAELMSALIVGVIIAFYFMFWRPDQKAKDRHKKDMRDLRPGDQVLTTSNFIATIKDIQVRESGETYIKIELADGFVVTALPHAILRRMTPAGSQSNATNQEGASV